MQMKAIAPVGRFRSREVYWSNPNEVKRMDANEVATADPVQLRSERIMIPQN